jgi:uncharacterized protein
VLEGTETRHEPRARRPWPLVVWILPDTLAALLLAAALALPILVVASWLRAAQGTSLYIGDDLVLSPPLFFMLVMAQNLAFAGVTLLRTLYLAGRSPAWLGLRLARPLTQIGLGLAAGLGFLVLNIGLSILFRSMGIEQNQAELYPLQAGDLLGQLLIGIAGAVFAPIGEELFFRGYVYGAVRERFGVAAAVVGSALLFGVAHVFSATEGLLALILPVMLLGLLLGLVRERSGSLLACIVAHMLNNSVGLGLIALCTNNPGLEVCGI